MRRALLGSLTLMVALAACDTDTLVVVDDDVPAPPVGTAVTYYAGSVSVTWSLGAGWNGEAFRIYSRRVTDSDYFFIAEVTSCIDDFCTYEDLNVLAGETYEYLVAAVSAGGVEADGASVEIFVPQWTPPPVPDAPAVIALDGANYLIWGAAARTAGDFSHYKIYLDDVDGAFLLGETDSEGFLDLLAENGSTYTYFVSSVDADGHESDGSLLAGGTPRPDFTGEWIFDYSDVPASSGFRFQEDEMALPVMDGDDLSRHFRLESDVNGWYLVPGPDAEVYPTGFPTTALKCGVAADVDCVDVSVAPLSGYSGAEVTLSTQVSYVLRVRGDDGQLHYGVIRVSLLGFDQNDDGIMILDWAYQIQPGNPNLAPPSGD